MSNTELWDKLGRTDPAHTKAFSRAGGFKGTAIKPMWAYRRMTEEFGACGVGWGVNEPSFQVVPSEGEILVYCTASIWHGQRDQVVFGVGGDKVATKRQSGQTFCDDEAFKKSFTDAITNALKLIGVGADVHMGRFDDVKYVNEMKQEFSEPEDDGGRAVYIEGCKKKIASFQDGNSEVKDWWDGQKQARRDFGLNSEEVNELKEMVIRKLPNKETAA